MKIGVIGAGISGLSAAWLLSKKHEVHLFESENRLGGHAHTYSVKEGASTVPVDTGFLVYNELTYPNLTSFFKALNVETVDSEMSLSIQVSDRNLEWSGTDLNSIFGQRSNLLKPNFYRMLIEIMRFGREAEHNLMLSARHAWTLGELLANRRFSKRFLTDYLLPVGAAIWSTPEFKILDFPASTFLTFFMNHKLLQVNNRPIWKTVKNGSIQYVQKVAAEIPHIHLSSEVVEVERIGGKVNVKTNSGTFEFDRVIMATHAPITMNLLKLQSDQEKKTLSAFKYEANRTVLHTDSSLMPQNQRCWSAWNVYGRTNLQAESKVSLTYYINRLQPLPSANNYFVTLNPNNEIDCAIKQFSYSHPLFDQNAIRAQRELASIQGNGGVYFAGAWSRYGFHEDGLLSAVKVAQLFNVEIPWQTTAKSLEVAA